MDFEYVEMWIVYIIVIVVQIEGDKIHSYHFKGCTWKFLVVLV
jgi:hypothetical protein